jgi:hypothetical protein
MARPTGPPLDPAVISLMHPGPHRPLKSYCLNRASSPPLTGSTSANIKQTTGAARGPTSTCPGQLSPARSRRSSGSCPRSFAVQARTHSRLFSLKISSHHFHTHVVHQHAGESPKLTCPGAAPGRRAIFPSLGAEVSKVRTAALQAARPGAIPGGSTISSYTPKPGRI